MAALALLLGSRIHGEPSKARGATSVLLRPAPEPRLALRSRGNDPGEPGASGQERLAEEATLQVPRDEALAPSLRELLLRLDPNRAGWPSEAREREVARALSGLESELRDLVERSARAPSSTSEDRAPRSPLSFASRDALAGALAPGLEEPWTRASGELFGRRQSEAAASADELRPLAERLSELGRRFRAIQRFKLKVETVEIGEDSLRTQLLVHVAGESRVAGRAELSGRWLAEWSPSAGGALQLHRLRSLGTEELRAGSVRFVDRTQHLTGGLADFGPADGSLAPIPSSGERPLDYGWGAGLGDLRRRLDTRLGVPLLGAPAGIAVGDVNGDGWEDVYLCQPGGLPNRLLLHGADHSLVDVSASSGADFLDFSRSALLVDFDGDGDRDLVVTLGNRLVWLANDGAGVFTMRADHAAPESTSMAAADFDLDGDLDLYVCAYFSPYDDGNTSAGGGGLPTPYHDARNGQPNLLFENRGEWEFVEVARARGLDDTRFSFAASWEDFDLDGDPDLYVANDFGRNNLYRNDGGSFVDVAARAGVEDVSAGMGVSWGDYDGDGRFDLCVSNMYSAAGRRITTQPDFHRDADSEVISALRRHARGNSLFRNLGDGVFEDVSEAAGITVGRWAWGARFCDIDGDGRLDILSPNGFLTGHREDDL